MQPEKFTVSNQIDNLFQSQKGANMNLSALFPRGRISEYIHELNLFVAHFNDIPNCIFEQEINCKKANKWFLKSYASEIKENHYIGKSDSRNKSIDFYGVFYLLYEDLIVNFSRSSVLFLFRKTDVAKIQKIIGSIRKFKETKTEGPKILLLMQSHGGITTESLAIKKPKLSIEDNYNEDFKEIHKTILGKLSRKHNKGIVLLHGKPGTGKTSYIRYLICAIKKEVIFLPPNMASAITNPDLISILIQNPNSILVIEDAENIVVDRNKNRASPVSAILNIADGLLSDCLNIQIICSFNTDISKIDNALMRKGRLIAKYEFKDLETQKAQHLSNKLGFSTKITQPMALSSIYNQDEKDFQELAKNSPIGFLNNKL